MATTKEYKNFIVEQLNLLENIECKPMMGEYLLYYDGKLFGGIYDNRLLIKIVDSNKMYGFVEELPYKGAKNMYLVDEIDDKENLRDIVIETCKSIEVKNKSNCK